MIYFWISLKSIIYLEFTILIKHMPFSLNFIFLLNVYNSQNSLSIVCKIKKKNALYTKIATMFTGN